jgi:cellulose synthase operon protein C
MSKKNGLLVPVLAGVLVVGAAGGGAYYAFVRNSDPFHKAEALMAKGDLRAAQIEYRNAVRNDPNSGVAHLKLAQAQAQMGDPVAAEKEFKTARDLGIDRWQIIPQLGQVYLAQNRYQDVLTEVPPEGPNPDALARNLMLRAMAQVGLNQFDAAQATLAQAEKIAPNNVEVLLTSARLALGLKDMAKAEEKSDQALKADPKSVDALLMRGQVLAAKGDRAEALKMADRAVELDPNGVAARLDRANQLINAGDDKKARLDVDKVLELQPRNAGATYLRAVLLLRDGKYADAQAELTKLTPVINRFPRALYFQALAAANLGQTESAIDAATRYIQRAPGDQDGVRLVARAELQAQRPERAVAVLNRAIAAGNADPQTLDLLGRAYTLMGRNQEAADAFRRATREAPDNPTFLTHLATSQMQAGDPAKATASLERSMELAPQQPNVGEALVAAALSAGDMDKAEQALAKLRAQVGDTEAVGILGGMVKLGKLDLEGGRAAFAATLKQFPDSVNAKLNLAKVLILQGKRQEGDALLREILAKEPANIPTLNTAVQLLMTDQNYPAAIQLIEAARAAAPKNAAFTAMLSDVMVRSGDPRRAVALLQGMRNSEELPPLLLAALARAQSSAGLNDEAKATYRDLLKVAPNDLDVRRAQVDLLLRLNEIDAAKASLREALEKSPGNIGVMSSLVQIETRSKGIEAGLAVADELRNNPANLPASALLKGDALMLAQRYNDAAQAFLAEYKVQPTGPLTLRLANALAAAGKDEDSAATLREWLKREPGDPDASQMLAVLDLRHRRYDDAQVNLEAVLAKRPNDAIAMNNLAWVYSVKDDPRARNLAQRAYLQAPTAETADTLGWIMVKGGDAAGAVPLLRKSMSQNPNDLSVRYHLAVALKDTGEKDEAVKLLQPLVNGREEFDDKPAARKLLQDLSGSAATAPAPAPAAPPAAPAPVRR